MKKVRVSSGVAVLLVVAGVAGCADAAQPKYGECVTAEAQGDVVTAAKACEGAVAVDPNSTSGKAAAEKLAAMQPALTKAKAEKAERDAKAAAEKAKQDEADRQARAEATAARTASLRQRVKRKYDAPEPDSLCTGKGLPPYRWYYEGGSFDEDAEVASSDGCVAAFVTNNTTFCCPKKPMAFPF